MGAAYLAGLSTKYWKDLEEITQNGRMEHMFYPKIEERARLEKIKGWNKAIRYSFGWSNPQDKE